MSISQIAYIICGVIFIVFTCLAIWGYFYRKNHPYNMVEIENSNWFWKFVKSNALMLWAILIVMLAIIAITFFLMVNKPNNQTNQIYNLFINY